MDEKTRLAVRQAAASSAPSVTADARPKIDAYHREAAALLCAGLSRRVAQERIQHRMGLSLVRQKVTDAADAWLITQSTMYTHLQVLYASDHVASWELVKKEG